MKFYAFHEYQERFGVINPFIIFTLSPIVTILLVHIRKKIYHTISIL